MKISTYIIILVLIGGAVFVVASMTQEAETKYGISVDTSAWQDKYNYAQSINNSISPLSDSLDKIRDEDTGWFGKIIEGVAAVPRVVVLVPSLLFNTFAYGSDLIIGTTSSLKIPAELVMIFIISITVWGIFKLIEFYQRQAI